MKAQTEYGRFTKRLIDRTIEIFEPHYGRKLSPQDAFEILDSMSAFVKALGEIAETKGAVNAKALCDG